MKRLTGWNNAKNTTNQVTRTATTGLHPTPSLVLQARTSEVGQVFASHLREQNDGVPCRFSSRVSSFSSPLPSRNAESAWWMGVPMKARFYRIAVVVCLFL